MATTPPINVTFRATIDVPSVGDGSANLTVNGYVDVFNAAYKAIEALYGADAFEAVVMVEFTPPTPKPVSQ